MLSNQLFIHVRMISLSDSSGFIGSSIMKTLHRFPVIAPHVPVARYCPHDMFFQSHLAFVSSLIGDALGNTCLNAFDL